MVEVPLSNVVQFANDMVHLVEVVTPAQSPPDNPGINHHKKGDDNPLITPDLGLKRAQPQRLLNHKNPVRDARVALNHVLDNHDDRHVKQDQEDDGNDPLQN